ncbi:hypothetical protein D3C75_1144590 [compost metagenome]
MPIGVNMALPTFPALLGVAFKGTEAICCGEVAHPEIHPTATTNASEDTIFIVNLPPYKGALK